MVRFAAAASVAAVTFYMAMIYGNTAFALLGFAEVFFVLLALLSLIFLRSQCEAGLHIPIGVAEQGDKIHIRLWNRQLRGFAPGRVRALVTASNYFSDKKNKVWIEGNQDYLYRLQLAGSYEICLKRIRIYDPSGLFYVTKRIGVSRIVEAIPELCAVSVSLSESVRNFFGDTDQYDDFRPGYDPAELFDVREFQDGDRIQNIHWKMSARTDTFMVKEHSLPKACAIALVADFRLSGKKDGMDHFLKLVTGISFSLMDQKCPHYVAWCSPSEGGIVRARVDDEESFYQFLIYFLREQADRQADAAELYREKYRGENLLHLLTVNEDLEIRKGQEIIGKVEEKDFRQKLETLTLNL